MGKKAIKLELERNMTEYERIAVLKDALDAQMEAIRKDMHKQMNKLGEKVVENDYATFKVVAAHQKTKVDTKKLKQKYPNVFKLVASTTDVKEAFRVQAKKK